MATNEAYNIQVTSLRNISCKINRYNNNKTGVKLSEKLNLTLCYEKD